MQPELGVVVETHRRSDVAAPEEGAPAAATLVFRSGDTCHDFYWSTAIPTDQARLAAREFAATGRQPTTITWRQEPGQRHA